MKEINIKHPLLQFSVVGVLLFGLNYIVTNQTNRKEQLLIDDSDLENSIQTYSQTWEEIPDSSMVPHLLEQQIEQKVLYEKGLELGLDKNNRRVKELIVLSTKEYLMSQADLSDPGDAVLQLFWKEHKDNFEEPGVYSFEQYFFEADSLKAASAQKQLKLGKTIHGVTNSALSDNYKEVTAIELAKVFGKDFSMELDAVTADEVLVLKSLWGWHVIRMTKVQKGATLSFDSQRQQVLKNWREQQQRMYYEAALNELKRDVKVALTIDSLEYLNTKQ